MRLTDAQLARLTPEQRGLAEAAEKLSHTWKCIVPYLRSNSPMPLKLGNDSIGYIFLTSSEREWILAAANPQAITALLAAHADALAEIARLKSALARANCPVSDSEPDDREWEGK